MMNTDRDGLLRGWIHDHRVSWELLPHFEIHDHRKIQIGFDLTLYAEDPGALGREFDDAEGPRIQEMLREIAHRVLPPESATTHIISDPSQPAVRLRPETGFRTEIALNLEIVHRHEDFAEADAEERAQAGRVERELRSLGAHAGVWPEGLK